MYLIDNSNFCYKFRSVYSWAKKEVNGVLVDTSVLVGYIRSLKSNLFDNIVIVLDGVPVQSLDSLQGYKGQRSKEKDGIGLGVPYLEVVKFLSKIGSLIGKQVQVVCAPQQEADQVISSICHLVTNNLPPRASFIEMLNTKELSSDRVLKYLDVPELRKHKLDVSASTSVVIASTDADMLQLQRFDGVCVDTSTSGKQVSHVTTAKAVCDLPPAAVPLYKAIYGDVSDNIPPIGLKHYTKEHVCKVLSKVSGAKTAESFHKFINSGPIEGLDINLQKIATAIAVEKKVQDFNRNWDVTFLKFYSTPFVLNFDDYDINDTIKKYGLRI